MPTTARLGRPLLGLAVVSMIGACSGAAASAPAPTPAISRAVTPPPAASPAPDATVSSDAWLVVGRPGDDRLHVILASTEEEMLSLPMGTPDDGWANVIDGTPGWGDAGRGSSGGPRLRWSRAVGHRAWRLPTVGLDPVPVGVSADGSTIVLVEAEGTGGAADGGPSRFAILARTLQSEPRIVELAGAFEFDALSPDGSLLYVVEHLPGPPAGHYQVRVVETATGVLRPDVIVDKRNVDEAMAGWPVAQARRPDGMVFTLYRGRSTRSSTP